MTFNTQYNQTPSAPAVDRSPPEEHAHAEQRDTMKPQDGEKLPQQNIPSDTDQVVDHTIDANREDVPHAPADLKAGRRV